MRIVGGNSKAFYGRPADGVRLDVRSLSGVSSYEPSELVVTARAGTTLKELEAALDEHQQFLPFDPPRYAVGGTVGGMVAAGLAGPSRASVGSVRDHVLGLTLLNGRAEVLTFGGQVAKNVAGYDVSRLMVGALGILGVICEVSIKVLPQPKALLTLRFDCAEGEARQRLDGWASQALPLNASAWIDGQLMVRLCGARAAVAEAAKRLGGEALEPDAARRWWDGIRDQQHPFFGVAPAQLAAGERVWRVCVPRTAGALALDGTQLLEWHGAQRWWRTRSDVATIRRVATAARGHATLFRGPAGEADVFQPLSTALLKIHQGLKRSFDPHSLFNPGRLYAEL